MQPDPEQQIRAREEEEDNLYRYLSTFHDKPYEWLSSMTHHLSLEELKSFVGGCRALVDAGLTPAQVKSTIEGSPMALDALVDGNYESAIHIGKAKALARVYRARSI